jgi:hypothetical protein
MVKGVSRATAAYKVLYLSGKPWIMSPPSTREVRDRPRSRHPAPTHPH